MFDPLIVQDINTLHEYDDLRYPFEVKVPWEKRVTRQIEDAEDLVQLKEEIAERAQRKSKTLPVEDDNYHNEQVTQDDLD